MLACCIDKNFAELAAVMLRSAHLNGNIPDVEFCIFGDGLLPSDKEKLQQSVGRPISFVDIDDAILKNFQALRTTNAWSRVIYARLFLPDCISESHPRIVYLDADTLILGDMSYLFNLPLQDNLIAGVVYPVSSRLTEMNRALGRDDDAVYFNSGVLVINAARWRSEKMSARSFELLRSRDFDFPDQDVLNLLADGRVIPLDWRWNAQKAADYAEAVIVHFTHAKPNSVECRHPQREAFLAMRAGTAWRNAPLRTRRGRRWKRIGRSISKRWLAIRRRFQRGRVYP